MQRTHLIRFFFFFNDTATTEIYTLSLHDALPILRRDELGAGLARIRQRASLRIVVVASDRAQVCAVASNRSELRSEEHTSELQSQSNLVCRLLLEKKKLNMTHILSSCTAPTLMLL